MNTTSDLLILDEAPPEGKRRDTIHASLIGVLVFSLVLHAIIGLVIFTVVKIPEIKTPSKEDKVVHHVTLKKPQSAPDKPKEDKTNTTKTTVAKKQPPKPVAKTPIKSKETKPREKVETAIPYVKELESTKKTSDQKVISTKKASNSTPENISPQVSHGLSSKKSESQNVIDYSKQRIDKDLEATDESERAKLEFTKASNEFKDINFKRVLAIWVKPTNIEGEYYGVIKVRLNDKGDVLGAYINKSSGNLALDLSIVEAIKRTKRFTIPQSEFFPPSLYRSFRFEFDSNMGEK